MTKLVDVLTLNHIIYESNYVFGVLVLYMFYLCIYMECFVGSKI